MLILAGFLCGAAGRAQTRTAGRSGSSALQAHLPPEAQQLAAEAEDAVSRGDHLKAIEAYRKLAKLVPNVPEVHADLATADYSAGRLDDAAVEARAALKAKPALSNARYILDASLAESGHCQEALPDLEKDYPRAAGPLKLALGLGGFRCSMGLSQADDALQFARWLNHDYPDNPDVLYLSAHFYSDMSDEASQRLLAKAPGSYQAHQMSAEVLEMQGKTRDAIAEYRKVLAMNPRLPGIHFEIGRLLLEGQPAPPALAQARGEFEEELKIDPHNPGAEGELGEMAWQARNWDDAVTHFRAALRIDPGNEAALVGLGKSLLSAGRASEAVSPLEMAVRMAPDDPTAHYQLSFAYRHLNRTADAEKEMAAYRRAYDQIQQANQVTRSGLAGDMNAKP
ncbi:MAG TPA: tetratricopeptide repeat protein [Terriglobia bacterium]|nr:tetratricopeptide repeat protein [Terriglobia bacterium]